jgi:hypothetical protein
MSLKPRKSRKAASAVESAQRSFSLDATGNRQRVRHFLFFFCSLSKIRNSLSCNYSENHYCNRSDLQNRKMHDC